MQALLAADLADPARRGFIHPGDLAWWVGWAPKTPAELADRILLVEDDDRLLGWVMRDEGDVGEAVRADVPASVRERIDAWLGDDTDQTRYARDDDAASITRLAETGWEPVPADDFQAFEIDLAGMDEGEADPRVRAVAAGDDVRPRCSVTHAAFGVARPFDPYVEQYAAFMDSPAYPDGWDLVAWTDAGQAAACAIAWPDPFSEVGNFEPVATHPDHRRHGYGTAVLRDGCRRLRSAGMRRAIVRTPVTNHAALAMYRSAGFADSYVERAFRRAAPPRR
jgi:ribosomal protein S18 acetylase RimI-like enzyme